jgi:hypothetical protein
MTIYDLLSPAIDATLLKSRGLPMRQDPVRLNIWSFELDILLLKRWVYYLEIYLQIQTLPIQT